MRPTIVFHERCSSRVDAAYVQMHHCPVLRTTRPDAWTVSQYGDDPRDHPLTNEEGAVLWT